MPLYEYRCAECGHRFEVLQSMGASNESLACPRCDTPRPTRQLSTFAASTGATATNGGCEVPGCGAGSGFT